MPEEIWKSVPRFQGRYEVSNLGNIRSLNRKTAYTKASGATSVSTFRGRLLKQRLNPEDGQMCVTLSDMGRQKTLSVSRIVAEAFLPDFKPNLYVYHKDGDLTNNCVDNLFLDIRTSGRSMPIKSVTTGKKYKSIGEVARKHNISEYVVRKKIAREEKIGEGDEAELYEFIVEE